MNAKWIVHVTAPLGKGQLVAKSRVSKPSAVYYVEKERLMTAPVAIKYVQGARETTVKSLLDIKKIAQRQAINLTSQIPGHEFEYASIVSFLSGLGTVVRPVLRYEYLESEYQIPLEQNTPRLEGVELKFLALKVDLEIKSPLLLRIRVSMDRMSLSEEVLLSFGSDCIEN